MKAFQLELGQNAKNISRTDSVLLVGKNQACKFCRR